MKISQITQDLIKRLVCDQKQRLNVKQIKNHLFFKGVDWNNLRNQKTPFVPQINGNQDTKYFDKYDEIDPWIDVHERDKDSITRYQDTNFIGYTFKREDQKQRDNILYAIEQLEKAQLSSKQGRETVHEGTHF